MLFSNITNSIIILSFDFSKYLTPGGTLFGPSKSKLDGLITYYHPDGRKENVLYVNKTLFL